MIMDEIVLFSNFLRNEGMSVSIRSTVLARVLLDSMRDLMTQDELYYSLKAIYLKDMDDLDKFERAFKKIFRKIELKPEDTPKSNIENVLEENNETILHEMSSESDLEELQELYDQMIEDRKNNEAKEGRMMDGSLLLLDTFDPRLFELCRRLSRKIANKRAKRRKLFNSHHINMPKTIRSNIKNGGHCVKLSYDKPPKKKSKHIFLCDVSGSCEWTTSFFLLLLYGCKRTFHNVKIYDFDNKLTDVTDLMDFEKFNNVGQVSIAQKTKGITCYGQSDMTKSFEQFLDQAELNHRTDVIILTDCRDWKAEKVDGMIKSALLVKQMVQKCNQVIILNPEKKIRWNNATSYVNDYEKAGAKVFETSSLSKFEQVITQL